MSDSVEILPTLVDLKTIMTCTGLSRPGIYKMMSEDRFPKPIKLGRSSRWYLTEIRAWLQAQPRKTQPA